MTVNILFYKDGSCWDAAETSYFSFASAAKASWQF